MVARFPSERYSKSMAKAPKKPKITFLDPMSEEFTAALTGAFRSGVREALQGRRRDGQVGIPTPRQDQAQPRAKRTARR